ncbi:hypothetical protein LU631_20825 [Erwinia tracheiphila]|uniref:Uncharacterized protein n=1 Tax=Erwinia tracheiphila TaxID=65700 RepID=A0A0M2KET5_9GAMM|nr:hypothetical protein [Erwinia tracheiphila]EOS92577.1 hypothetical protein ETR_23729 [Erwinia tracheiphila PSU-1]KKF35867.1 hypothetical protein SY86_11210 [Erwinia tracheiphila]UIA87185.1 hypothetical protein LU631_20825 [Erwinia tracheiphila]UIA95545.1 hypothetical protein LU633_19275 [Erwinia tracheiphila]
MSGNGFDPKDVAEICSRKKSKFRMKKADFKELGRNVLLGTIDVTLGAVKAGALMASHVPDNKKQNQLDEVYEGFDSDGYKHGTQGYGYYRNGKKD